MDFHGVQGSHVYKDFVRFTFVTMQKIRIMSANVGKLSCIATTDYRNRCDSSICEVGI